MVGYQSFTGPRCLLPQHCTASQPRRPRSEISPPRKPQNSVHL